MQVQKMCALCILVKLLLFLVNSSIEPKSCGSTYCFLSHPCLFDAMKSYFLVLHSWSPRRWTSLHYLPIQNLFPFEVAKCNAMQASSIKQMVENEMQAAKKSSEVTYLPYLFWALDKIYRVHVHFIRSHSLIYPQHFLWVTYSKVTYLRAFLIRVIYLLILLE